MCIKPKVNSSEVFRKELKRDLRAEMLRQYQQFPKVGRKRWWEVLVARIERILCGR